MEKVEGNKEKCFSCKQEIICRKKPASGNYPESLQWQNLEGGAHYKYDFKTGNTTCKTTDVKPDVTINNTVNWPELPDAEITPEMIQIMDGEKWFTALACRTAKERYPSLDVNTKEFGQIVHTIVEKYISLALVKATKEHVVE